MIVLLENQFLYKDFIIKRIYKPTPISLYEYIVENKDLESYCIPNLNRNEVDSTKVLRDVVIMGRFIEEELIPNKSKFSINYIPSYDVERAKFIDSVYEKDKERKNALEIHIINIFKKYGIDNIEHLRNNIENIKYYNITDFLNRIHYIYQLFFLGNHIKSTTIKELKLYKFEFDDEKNKMILLDILNEKATYKPHVFFNKAKDTYINRPVFNSIIDICYYELINTLLNSNSEASLTMCIRCGNPIVITNRNRKICSKEENEICRLGYDNERKKKSNLKKNLEKERKK